MENQTALNPDPHETAYLELTYAEADAAYKALNLIAENKAMLALLGRESRMAVRSAMIKIERVFSPEGV